MLLRLPEKGRGQFCPCGRHHRRHDAKETDRDNVNKYIGQLCDALLA